MIIKKDILHIAIVGNAPNYYFVTENEYDEIWYLAWNFGLCNYDGQLNDLQFKTCKSFDMHPIDSNRVLPTSMNDYIDVLASYKQNLIINSYNPRLPRATIYPLNEVEKEIGRRYFLSSFGYMMGLALISCKPKSIIELYGIDFSHDELRQLANLEYLCGIAEGREIKVIAHPSCDILGNTYMYGYHYQRQVAGNNRNDPHLVIKQ